jgi:hypothetical protein
LGEIEGIHLNINDTFIKKHKIRSMKTSIQLILILSLSFFVIQCQTDKPNNIQTEKKEPVKAKEMEVEPIKEEVLEPANLTTRIFFTGSEYSEEGELIQEYTEERKPFRTNHSYTFCYDSESFHSLQLEGTGKSITIEVKSGNKILFKKENFDLTKKITFDTGDFDFSMAERYTIIVRQVDEILFTGKIDSQGCM